jgi:indole-3-glycerol phosphate synthase
MVNETNTKTGEKTILQRIVEARRESVAHRKRVLPEPALKMAVQKQEPPRDFAAALARTGCNVIAELKKASPSLGLIRERYAPAALAMGLESAGAAALSVLTEEEFFLGSLGDLKEAKKAVAIPILRKDFVFDPWQVWETRAAGADTFLLIVAILSDERMAELLALGRELGMEPLVEVHSREELARAKSAGARIIGVNNRDLRDFRVTLETSLELIDEVPDNAIAVSESGLHTREDLARLRRAGFDAFLIGERLMKQADPAEPLRELLGLTADGQRIH